MAAKPPVALDYASTVPTRVRRLSFPSPPARARIAAVQSGEEAAMKMTLTVNGRPVAVTVDDPQMPLLYALRDELGLHGPRFGCGLGNAAPAPCTSTATPCARASMPVGTVTGSKVVTLEGLGTPETTASAAEGLHRRAGRAVRLLHQRHDHAGQGTCSTTNPKPSDDEIKAALVRAICAAAARICASCARSSARRSPPEEPP